VPARWQPSLEDFSELCDMRIRDLRLRAASGAHFRIPDAKTDAGVREVHVSPDLLAELVAHVDRRGRADLPTEPDAYLFPNLRGGRMARQRANAIVHVAAALASSRLAARGLPALPNTTPQNAAPHVHLGGAGGEPVRRALG